MILYDIVCMYVWMDGWMYGCMNAWMHGCMYVYSLENLLFQINIVDVFLLNAESPFLIQSCPQALATFSLRRIWAIFGEPTQFSPA